MDEAIKIINVWLSLDDTSAELNLSGLNLKELPAIPKNCHLNCSNNQLTQLPELIGCWMLDCENNQLTSLPELPYCSVLYCDNNNLTTLPELPSCWRLSCEGNKITYFPQIHHCMIVNCDDNKYLHISKDQAKNSDLEETPNYNKYAQIIQRAFKRHLRKQYLKLIIENLFMGPAKIVCSYTL